MVKMSIFIEFPQLNGSFYAWMKSVKILWILNEKLKKYNPAAEQPGILDNQISYSPQAGGIQPKEIKNLRYWLH